MKKVKLPRKIKKQYIKKNGRIDYYLHKGISIVAGYSYLLEVNENLLTSAISDVRSEINANK